MMNQEYRLKYSVMINPSTGRRRSLSDDSDVSFLPMESIGEYGSIDLSQTKKYEDVKTGYTYFEEDDVVFAKITPCFENGKGTIGEGLINYVGYGTTELHVLRPISDLSYKRFIYYLTMSHHFRKNGESEMYGAGGQKRVPSSYVENYKLYLPSFKTQKQIADFLDKETTRIDTLISKKQKQIDLLQEKRQAIITQSVTKGLNENVKMKDSGVEWIGEIPEHWGIVSIGLVSQVSNGTTPNSSNPDFWEDGDIPWTSSAEVNQEFITIPTKYITQKALKETSLKIIKRNSVLIGLIGQGKTRGLTAILGIDSCINQNVASIEPSDKVSSRFLRYFLVHSYEPIRNTGRGGQQDALNNELVRSIRIPFPPRKEQDEISEYIEQNDISISILREKILSSVNLLKEYRSSLITHAVSGQIDITQYEVSK